MPVPDNYKLGRKARAFDPRVPHYSAVRLMAPALPPTPVSHDWSASLPTDLGMMLNDRYGDCVFAAAYHSIQLCTRLARGVEVTEPDRYVQQAYSEVTGFNPDDPTTDRGTVMQDAMKYALTKGLPIEPAPAPRDRHKYLAYIEVDPRNMDDMCEAIYQFGAVHIGFQVPAWLFADGTPPQIWDQGADPTIEGGHCVLLSGFDRGAQRFNVVSWGLHNYQMTWRFFQRYADEAYAVADPSWIEVTGRTPLGLTTDQLRRLMASIRRAGT